MKRLFVLCSTLCLGLLTLLTGCGNQNNLPNIEGTMEIESFKTVLAVKTTFTDSDTHDLYQKNVRAFVTLTSTGEEVKEISRKDVTLNLGDEPETELTGNKLEFSNLTADTKYTFRLIISANGSQKVLSTKEASTIDNGEAEEDPILISNLDQLLGMNKTKDAYYKLTTDIDCGGSLASIFNSSNIFSGHFDGDGHKIFNFKMDSNQYTGLFGYMSGATVKNLTLDQVSYEATRSNTYLGALTGYAKNCVIENVVVNQLTVSHSGQTTTYGYIGGFVGKAENSEIKNCSVKNLNLTIPSAKLKMYVGGFVGENRNSLIKDCDVTGSISTTISYTTNKDGCLYVGGFSGINDSGKGIFTSYSNVDIEVKEPETVTSSSSGKETFKLYAGGFNGGNNKDASRIDSCASVGDITVTVKHAYFAYIGGFVGYTDENNISRFAQCIYVPKTNGLSVTFAENPKDENEEQKQTAYVSLGVGKISAKAEGRALVSVYSEKINITNRHEKVTVTEYTVSQDLTSLPEIIRDLILNLQA